MKKIAVVGSINVDYVIETKVFPKGGETVFGESFFTSLGGKGLNQAIAASRAGGNASLFASIGQDDNGQRVLKSLEKEKVNIRYLQKVEQEPTGVAFIQLHEGENRIIVISGANKLTNIDYIQRLKDELLTHDVILFQLETPIEMIEYIIPILSKAGKTIIMDPAPAYPLKQETIDAVTYLLPNEHECVTVYRESDKMDEMLRRYPRKLIITRGSKGVSYFDDGKIITVPALKVEPVDTTGAGDTFAGAFAVAVAKGMDLYDCVKFGNIAAGLSVTKKGAQAGIPYADEIFKHM